MVDHYRSMTALIAQTLPSKDWEIISQDNQTTALVTAVHGGAIERGTSEIAQLTSEYDGLSFYTFKGTRKNKNNELHVTSRHFDEPNLKSMVKRHAYIISFHGCMGNQAEVYIGGKDLALAKRIQQHLEAIGVTVKPAPAHISGMHADNFVNEGTRLQGVQLELTVALRKKCFKNNKYNLHDRENRENWSQFMFEFTSAINTALHELINEG